MTSQQNGEPGKNHCKDSADYEECQDNVMRDHEKPFEKGHPPVEISFCVGVVYFQVGRLLVDGGRVSVREQTRISTDSSLEAGQLARKIEPPAWIKPSKEDH